MNTHLIIQVATWSLITHMTEKRLLCNAAILNLLAIIRISNCNSLQKVHNYIVICTWKGNRQTIETVILDSVLFINSISRKDTTSITMFNRTQKSIQIVKNRIWVNWLLFQPQLIRSCWKISFFFDSILILKIIIQHFHETHLHQQSNLKPTKNSMVSCCSIALKVGHRLSNATFSGLGLIVR